MVMRAKERWHCVNPTCGCQVIVEIGGVIDGQNPRCACGGIMKKNYAAPSFSYLDFAHIDEPPSAKAALSEEEPCSSLS
jgi:hypothetical protein